MTGVCDIAAYFPGVPRGGGLRLEFSPPRHLVYGGKECSSGRNRVLAAAWATLVISLRVCMV
jgi:hypothetical protein